MKDEEADITVKIKEKVEKAGGVYLTTTVFGQPPAARARQLVVVSSGDPQGREKVRPLLEFIGKKVIDVGDDNAKGESALHLSTSHPSKEKTCDIVLILRCGLEATREQRLARCYPALL